MDHPPADKSAARRPIRSDPTLRERSALALPGWLGLLASLVGIVALVLVLGRFHVALHPAALPDISRLPPGGSHAKGFVARTIVVSAAMGLLVILGASGLLINTSGHTRVLTRWGSYRGSVRRTGLLWVNPLLCRRQVDVRLRHWLSHTVNLMDRTGTPIMVQLLIVWRVKDTARALFAVTDHESYLREQVHAVLTRTASTLPCDSNTVPGPALRDGQWFEAELTRALAAAVASVGLEICSVQPLHLDYAPEVAESVRRRRLADLEAGLHSAIVDDTIDAAALTVRRLERVLGRPLKNTERDGLLEQLVVAFIASAGTTHGAPSAHPKKPTPSASSQASSSGGEARPTRTAPSRQRKEGSA